MNKRLLKDVVLFGAGLYIGGMWVKAKVTDAFIDGAEERKRPIDYKTYESRRHKEKKECNTKYNVYTRTEFIFADRCDALEVMGKITDIIAEYGYITVADVNDLVGVMSNYTDNKKGWIDIQNMGIIEVKDGHKLYMPKAIRIND